jgi:hypothetical protein
MELRLSYYYIKFALQKSVKSANTVISKQDSISIFNKGGLRSGAGVPIEEICNKKTLARNSLISDIIQIYNTVS